MPDTLSHNTLLPTDCVEHLSHQHPRYGGLWRTLCQVASPPAVPRPTVIMCRLLIATCILVCAAACSRQPTETSASASATRQPATPVVPNPAPLPRREITVADRVRWFARLGWPQDCEDAFTQTRLTDDAGLEIHALPSGAAIAVLRCALGAYQPTSVVLMFDERPPARAATVLEFPTFESTDGKTLTPARTREIAGEITWLENAGALVVLTLARQIGDCGTWARYVFADGAPKLMAFAAQVACPDDPGPRVDPQPGEPPRGWKTISMP